MSAVMVLGVGLGFSTPGPAAQEPQKGSSPAPRPQTRPHGEAIAVDPAVIRVDDGDSVFIRWGEGDVETVRILGIDTPETRHEEHGIVHDQPFGPEARAFARGAFAAAGEVKLIRASTLDPYGRTLGYLFLNGKNYSVLVIRARLSDETVGHYGDNGLPGPAAEVTAAARDLGPLDFEPPHAYRKRMRTLSDWRKAHRDTP
jgi:endonuclease YncB( thermonuclease family)